MTRILLICALMALSVPALHAQWKTAQRPVAGSSQPINADEIAPLRTPENWPLRISSRNAAPWSLSGARYLGDPKAAVRKVVRDQTTGLPIRLEGPVAYPLRNLRSASAADHAFSYLDYMRHTLAIDDPRSEFRIEASFRDELGQEHLRLRQYFRGVEIWGSEILMHRREGAIDLLHGRYRATPRDLDVVPTLSEEVATNTILSHVARRETVQDYDLRLAGPRFQNTKLVIYYPKDTPGPRLCWYTEVTAHPLSRWAYFLDANSGEVVHRFQLVCTLHPNLGEGHTHPVPNVIGRYKATNPTSDFRFPTSIATEAIAKEAISDFRFPISDFDGPVTAQATDLLGVTRTIGTYEVGNEYLMLDASRPMFNAQQSAIPDNPVGGILTLDARDSTVNAGEAFYVVSGSNTWNDPATVSAHYNAGICYEYFRSTHGRNSINGNGGTIFSIVNITDEDGLGLDNAFWNGQFMFYGNGREAFEPLAGALDVGAHEMTHGVIQNTANLVYQDEPGAINESFADVFGVLVDREDFQLGEDVVRRSSFPSGALRDMQNPNNGGSRLGDPGWQPASVSEQYLGDLDNGGVHINSGIPNRAFFLFANQVGLERAEQVYYRTLSTYLTRNSEFIDLRMAVLQAAEDLYGQTEVNAAAAAFDAVGITEDLPGNMEEPMEQMINPGDQYIAAVGANGFGLYLYNTSGEVLQGADPLINEEIISPPSISDDGSVIVFVNGSNQLRYVIIDWDAGQVTGNDVLSQENVWRRAAISKDAARIAVVTQEENDQILIFDFASQQQRNFELFNPTFSEGITSDEVQYADAMEWDITSSYLIYDAFNEVDGFGGGYTFWDIGVMEVWNRDTETFADGNIGKLFTQLPRGIAVGNPSVAKNSPDVVAFDYVDEDQNDLAILGYNIRENEVSTIFENNVISYPNYSTNDQFLVFNARTTNNADVVGIVEMAEDKINPAGQAQVFISNAQWPIWFATGDRVITDLEDVPERASSALRLFPNPVVDRVTLQLALEQPGDLHIELIDPLGRVVKHWSEQAVAGAWEGQYSMAGIPSGTYWIRVKAGTQVYTSPISK
jgi:Zn-dependent metalloprotease